MRPQTLSHLSFDSFTSKTQRRAVRETEKDINSCTLLVALMLCMFRQHQTHRQTPELFATVLSAQAVFLRGSYSQSHATGIRVCTRGWCEVGMPRKKWHNDRLAVEISRIQNTERVAISSPPWAAAEINSLICWMVETSPSLPSHLCQPQPPLPPPGLLHSGGTSPAHVETTSILQQSSLSLLLASPQPVIYSLHDLRLSDAGQNVQRVRS